MDIDDFSLRALAGAIASKRITAQECVEHCFEAIERLNPTLNAFVAVDEESAMLQAAEVDKRVASHLPVGTLAGVPFGVKDLEDVVGFRTTKGSQLLKDAPAATRDSVMVERFRGLGAIPIGKTNTPEFGWKAETDNRVFGPARNPLNKEYSPGGSSGGSASAVAGHLVPFATASDGGGSIRIPAALCGLPGFKVSLGRVPVRSTTPPNWADFSVVGPLARSFGDTAFLLDEIAYPAGYDIRSLERPLGRFAQFEAAKRVPKRIVASLTLGYADVDATVARAFEEAVKAIEAMGVEVVRNESIFSSDPVSDWLLMSSCYTRRTLEGTYPKADLDDLDPGLKGLLDSYADVTATQYLTAADRCFYLNQELETALEGSDLLISPAIGSLVPKLLHPGEINGVERIDWVQFTYPFNMTRSPASTFPVGKDRAGMPIAVQLVARRLDDLRLMSWSALLCAEIGRVPWK